MKELNQLVICDVFGEIDHDQLTEQQKKEALPILMFLTLKRDGTTVKGRGCADRQKQQLWTKKKTYHHPLLLWKRYSTLG